APGVLIHLTISITVLFADSGTHLFTFHKEKLIIGQQAGYDFIRYGNLELSGKPGAPLLPVKIAQLLIPPGKTVASIEVVATESEELEGEYSLFPVQQPQVLSNPQIKFTGADQRIYTSLQLFPAQPVRLAKQGYFAGYNIASILIFPLQYIPSKKKIIFHSRIQIWLIFKQSLKHPLPASHTEYKSNKIRQAIAKLVENAGALQQYQPGRNTTLTEEHRYVIITSDVLKSYFQPLADWKTQKGLSAKIVTTPEINANYPGIDMQEKIRNFIIHAYQNWGTAWILLGGDTFVIPDRKTWAMDCEFGDPSDNYIPNDLYYSDLDGNWNANGNTTYGEVPDSIDMYPDVFVGRASVENSSEAQAFVNKILTYEKNAPNAHELNMLFLAEVLWSNPYTNSGLGKNHIDSLYVPQRFDPITKLYEALGNENYSSVMDALNSGQNIINHNGHAGYTSMGIGSGYLHRSDMDILTNGPKYSILFSIGCWPAAFDRDCIAEHFLTNPNGGGVAFIGNSRYGWGSPGNPLYGYSDRFDQQFFKKLFTDQLPNIGNALAAAKAVYVPLASQENVYRWCEYEVNLLGDPEMPVWTDAPKTFVVSCPAELPAGNTQCQVSVTDGTSPVEGAMVCMMKENEVYQTALTGHNGLATFQFTTANPASDIQLTVTAPNFIPYESTISVVSNAPYAKISRYATNGSGEGFIVPGQQVSVDICVKNFGNLPANNVFVVLHSRSAEITFIDSLEAVGDILPGDSVIVTGAFTFHTSSALENGEVVYLNADISGSGGNTWNDLLSVTATTPLLTCFHHSITDSPGGDGDGFAEPGESAGLNLFIRNDGLLTAENVTVNLNTTSSDITIVNPSLTIGSISPSFLRAAQTTVQIDAACPVPSFPQINLLFQTANGYQFSDSLMLSVGEFGLWDDMESGAANWNHSGTPDLWHLTTHRRHSGNYSFYCGVEGSFVYQNYMANEL
ncbi:MAG: C25 family cysteine peptidase, partial [Calditrichia bacterium]